MFMQMLRKSYILDIICESSWSEKKIYIEVQNVPKMT